MDDDSRQPTTPTTPVPVLPADDGRSRHRRRIKLLALSVAGLVLGAGLVVAGGAALLYLVNPVGDEWICSEGEAPAGNACYPEGSTLPPGVSWDPLGNRPLSDNCDKHGWVPIERVGGEEADCLREGTTLPEGWRVVED